MSDFFDAILMIQNNFREKRSQEQNRRVGMQEMMQRKLDVLSTQQEDKKTKKTKKGKQDGAHKRMETLVKSANELSTVLVLIKKYRRRAFLYNLEAAWERR